MIGEVILLGIMVSMASTSQSESLVPPANYRLVFSDDFRPLDLSADGHGAHTWYEGVWFSAHHAPLSNIASTPAGLVLTWTRGQEQPDTSIATFSPKGTKSRAWRYGYFEVRM